ncbi:MAG: hypothetical protein ACYDAB_14455 [bacterium]
MSRFASVLGFVVVAALLRIAAPAFAAPPGAVTPEAHPGSCLWLQHTLFDPIAVTVQMNHPADSGTLNLKSRAIILVLNSQGQPIKTDDGIYLIAGVTAPRDVKIVWQYLEGANHLPKDAADHGCDRLWMAFIQELH